MTHDRHQDDPLPGTVGCGFLSLQELDAAVAGRLAPERRDEFERHAGQGCSACVMLAVDLATFRRILAGGPTETERAEADIQSESLRTRLRAEIRRREPASS